MEIIVSLGIVVLVFIASSKFVKILEQSDKEHLPPLNITDNGFFIPSSKNNEGFYLVYETPISSTLFFKNIEVALVFSQLDLEISIANFSKGK